jgi:hypothetical protein
MVTLIHTLTIGIVLLCDGCAPSDARCKHWGEPKEGPTIAWSKGYAPIYVPRGQTVQECVEYENWKPKS